MAKAKYFEVIDRDLNTPPAPPGPKHGFSYLVAAGGTGAWSGKDGDIAFCIATDDSDPPTSIAWEFHTPTYSDMLWVKDEKKLFIYHTSAWNQVAATSELSSYMPLAGGTFVGDVSFSGQNISAIDSIVYADKTAGTATDGRVEYENDDFWFYDSSRSKWLSKAMGMASFARSGTITTVQQLFWVGNTNSKTTPWTDPDLKRVIVGYACTTNGGTLTDTDWIVYRDPATPTAILTINVTSGSGIVAQSKTENVAIAIDQRVWAEVDPTGGGDNPIGPHIDLYWRWER